MSTSNIIRRGGAEKEVSSAKPMSLRCFSFLRVLRELRDLFVFGLWQVMRLPEEPIIVQQVA